MEQLQQEIETAEHEEARRRITRQEKLGLMRAGQEVRIEASDVIKEEEEEEEGT